MTKEVQDTTTTQTYVTTYLAWDIKNGDDLCLVTSNYS